MNRNFVAIAGAVLGLLLAAAPGFAQGTGVIEVLAVEDEPAPGVPGAIFAGSTASIEFLDVSGGPGGGAGFVAGLSGGAIPPTLPWSVFGPNGSGGVAPLAHHGL